MMDVVIHSERGDPAGPGLWRTLLRVVAAATAVLCVGLLAVGSAANATVLRSRYYSSVLDDEHVYTRVYDEVLVDPQLAHVTADLLANLPVPRSQLLANIKVVLPPTVLRSLVDEQISATLAYILGERATFTLRVDLTPVVRNIAHLGEQYLGDLIATLQQQTAPDFTAFLRSLEGALTALSEGRPPAHIPTIRLTPAQAAVAADALVRPVPAAERDRLRPLVVSALVAGDIGSALAAVGPFVLTPRATAAIRDLITRTGAVQWDVRPALERAGADFGAVHTARSLARVASVPAQIALLLVGLLGFAVLWRTGRGTTTRRLVEVGAVLAAGGVAAVGGVLVLRSLVSGIFPPPTSGWPPTLRRLVDDVHARATGEVTGAGILAAVLPIAAGILVVAVAFARVHRAAVGRALRHRRRLVLAVAATAVAVTLLAEVLVPELSQRHERTCLGSAALCGLRYDQTTFLATHNSMASTADRYLGPFQDPDMIDQLDQGARALLIDTHTWERGDEIAAKLRTSDFPPELRARLPSLIDRADPPKPGVWLCHVICRAGATALVPALVRLRQWLAGHRDEIVTLIIEDGITGEQTAQAFAAAGLLPLIQTPPADPSAAWPTLGAMVRANHRLVVFSQRTNGPARWYRKFYDYGMETPFAVPSPAALSCAPARGGIDGRLFLLNNFVASTGSSRLAAARVNRSAAIVDRARACEASRGATVNFVAVDFATIGDAGAAVDALNADRTRTIG